MSDAQRDMHVLISIAKLDAEINRRRKELSTLPKRLEEAQRKHAEITAAEQQAAADIEEMAKERRQLEQQLEDNASKIQKYKTQLMEVKTNKEYTAMLHEIEHIEKDTDAKEERLLILMDELDSQQAAHDSRLETTGGDKKVLETEQAEIRERIKTLETELGELETEKPKFLAELSSVLQKRYDRILAKLGDFAVTHVDGEICQGCFSRIPPQVVVEVKRNDRLITCETCGRILVHYDA